MRVVSGALYLSGLFEACFANNRLADGCSRLTALSQHDGFLAVAFATTKYASLARNWALSLTRLMVHNKVVLGVDFDSLKDAEVVPVRVLSPHAWLEWNTTHSTHLTALWLLRSATLEHILGVDCLPSHTLVLHSDVDVVFIRDPRPYLTECHSCFGAGEFPHELATKWQSATACAGFFARRAGDALRLNRRITQLTREFGDDQIATNQAIDELGLAHRISLLDPALFPVGGCDTWLGVLAASRDEVSPVVLHPNCVDKAGLSKEGWLRQQNAWLLLSDAAAENVTNTTAASVLAAASCRYKSDALRVTLQDTVLLLFEGERALIEIGDLLNQRRMVGTFTVPREAGILAKRRQQQGHAVFVTTTPHYLLFLSHCLEVPDDENGMTIVLAGLNSSGESPCLRFNAPPRQSPWLHRHLDALSHYTTTNGLSSHVHITNIKSCEAGRIVSAELVRLSALAPTEIWTRLHTATPWTLAIVDDGDGQSRSVHAQYDGKDTVYTKIALSLRRRHRITVRWFLSLSPTKGKQDEPPTFTDAVSLHTASVEYFESWLASLSPLFAAEASLSCLASSFTFTPCQRVVAANADLAIQFTNLSDTVAGLRTAGSVLFSIGTTIAQARQMTETAGLTIVDAHAGPLQITPANTDTYAVVVVWAIKSAQFYATQHSLIDTVDSALTAAYEQATRLEDHGARVDALFAAGARVHHTDCRRAATYYRRALQIQPSFGLALGNLAALEYNENRVTEAVGLLERAVAAGQNTSVEDLFRAQARLVRAKKAGLLERALTLVADDSRDATVRVVLNTIDDAALCVFTQWRDYIEAVIHGTPRLLYAPRFDDPEFFLATELTRRGYRVLTTSCNTLWATLEAGDQAYRRDKAAAARAYSSVIERCGGHLPTSDPTKLLPELLAGVLQNESARQSVKALAFYKLGVLAHERLELQEAEALYLSALECDSELADAWNNLGVIHIRTDRLESGAACFEKGGADENRRVATDLMLAQALWLNTAPQAHAKVHILAGFYQGASSEARFKNELRHAQRLNLGLESVVALHSFGEDVDPQCELNSEKLVAIYWRRQPDYADFLEYANHHLAGKVIVIAHTDIYFDETIGCASSLLLEAHAQRLAFAITRRPAPACPFESGGGHLHGLPTNLCTADRTIHGYDAFAFVAPVPEAVVAATRGLKQNALGSDLRFIDALRTLGGYTLYNPCAQIAAYHLHCTRERSYDFNATNRDLSQPVPVTKLSVSRRFNSLCTAPSPQPMAHGVVLVASYPRSGSTLLRNLVERVTATKTGSTHFDAGMLVDFGFLGEGYCAPSSVAVVKTHHPAILDFGPSDCQSVLSQAQANQAPMALLIRDPFDAIRSYWEYRHLREDYASWPDFAVAEARRWRLVVEYWHGAIDLTVRYEDLLRNPLSSLEALLSLTRLHAHTSSVDQLQPRRFDARTTYGDKLLRDVFVAAGGHDVLCTFGYEPPPLFAPCPASAETTPLLASPSF